MQMYDGEINDEHIWLKAYCALIGRCPRNFAKKYADGAVDDFHERFPDTPASGSQRKTAHPK
jgi:hypothetical protein